MSDISEFLSELFGPGIAAESIRSVAGGDINEAFLVVLNDGRRLFIKENTRRNSVFLKRSKGDLRR